MKNTNSKSSYWRDKTQVDAKYPALSGDIAADVVIVGAGITGITAAYELMKAGKKVVVVESHRVGGGTTGYSTGNLYVPIQAHYKKIADNFGEDTAIEVARARQETINYIEDIVVANDINCAFHRRPFYYFTNEEKNISKLDNEVDLLQKANLRAEHVTDLPLNEDFIKAAIVMDQARFNPYMYVTELANKVSERGCSIFENTTVTDVEETGHGCSVHTKNGKIRARQVFMATHIPKGFNMVQTLVYAHRSYVVGVHLKGEYPNGNFWNMDQDPTHAFSTHSIKGNDLNIMLFAGQHHKTGQSPEGHAENLEKIKQYISERYDVSEVAYEWSAQHYAPADGLPYIGKSTRTSNFIYMSTGYSTDGLTYGALGGKLVADLMLDNENKYAHLFDSTRFTPKSSAKEFIKENADVAAQYVKDFLNHVPKEEIDNIPNGKGKVISADGNKLAVHKDETGNVKALSAICTHMACVVHWNDAEKTWDCPCHGSRFGLDGCVIEGPAYAPLASEEPPTEE